MGARSSSLVVIAALGALVGAAAPAHALKPSTHADITQRACAAAGLPPMFCARAATEDYNADAHEWDDLHAHAQIDAGETACDAADLTALRLWRLGDELRRALAATAGAPTEDGVGRAGIALGRALHTIQDNCAHHGMPNPQHAWYSLTDFCEGTRLSPDVQADAAACARTETAAIMTAVAAAIRTTGVSGPLGGYACPLEPHGGDTTQRTICDARFLPAPWDACEFLGSAADWDGTDRQWGNARVVPALRAAFTAGLAGHAAPASICGGDEAALAPAVSAPVVDVSAGTPTCTRANVLCLGSADHDDHPFADDDELAEPDAGGCAVGGHARGLGLALALLALHRRARRAVPRPTR